MYWTLELASKLEDAPWPATKDELIDYAVRTVELQLARHSKTRGQLNGILQRFLGDKTFANAEKFFDIVCRTGKLKPDAVVMVVSIKALKRHGEGNDAGAVKKGLINLDKHLENISYFGVPVIVALNHYLDDKEDEIEIVENQYY